MIFKILLLKIYFFSNSILIFYIKSLCIDFFNLQLSKENFITKSIYLLKNFYIL